MHNGNGLLSVVIPAYNEEEMAAQAAEVISRILSQAGIPFELIFVDDGSSDGTWEVICQQSEKKQNLRGLRFSRNFGKESAILAGLSKATGDCAVVIDCDLQHPPEKITEMYRLWKEGYDIVEGVKTSRGAERGTHTFGAECFYRVMGKALGVDMRSASDFKLLDRKVIEVLVHMREHNAFFRAQSAWVGFKAAEVPFAVQERAAGKSKWTARALTNYAVRNITAYSNTPAYIVIFLGLLTLLLSLIFGTIALMQKFSGVAVEGFTTVIVLLLFIGSVIMISLGIIGYYISKIYEEIKARPRYIIEKECGNAVFDAYEGITES